MSREVVVFVGYDESWIRDYQAKVAHEKNYYFAKMRAKESPEEREYLDKFRVWRHTPPTNEYVIFKR
jgi:hypothetical protein